MDEHKAEITRILQGNNNGFLILPSWLDFQNKVLVAALCGALMFFAIYCVSPAIVKKMLEKADFNPLHHYVSYTMTAATIFLVIFIGSYYQRQSTTLDRAAFISLSASKQALVYHQRFVVDISMYLQAMIAFMFLALNFLMKVNRERHETAD